MDGTVRTWDTRPFAASDRLLQIFEGAPFGLEKNLIRASWSPKGDKIAAGSGDRTVVWHFYIVSIPIVFANKFIRVVRLGFRVEENAVQTSWP